MKDNINILLVEDNHADAVYCKIILERYFGKPFLIKHVNCLGAGISEVTSDEETYDIVLLDLNLNDSKGIHTLMNFRDYCKDCPIIVLSGISDEEIIKQVITCGGDSFIIKGEDEPATVIEEIEHVLKNFKYKLEYKEA